MLLLISEIKKKLSFSKNRSRFYRTKFVEKIFLKNGCISSFNVKTCEYSLSQLKENSICSVFPAGLTD